MARRWIEGAVPGTRRRAGLLAVACLLLAGQAGWTAEPRPLRYEINLLLDLHNWLMAEAARPEGGAVEYLTQVNLYRQARDLGAGGEALQVVQDLLAASDGIAEVSAKAPRAVSALAGPDREAASKMLSAFEAAWPRYEAHDMADRNRSLQRIQVPLLRKAFATRIEGRIMATVHDKLGLEPLDAPLTVYPVLQAAEVGAWGMTRKGYYLILPVARRGETQIMEMLVHETMHVLEGAQPGGAGEVSKGIRSRSAGSDPAEIDAFLHALVTWTAGDLIRRYARPTYRPLFETATNMADSVRPYLHVLEGPWRAWLESTGGRAEAMTASAEAIRTRSAPRPSAPPSPGG